MTPLEDQEKEESPTKVKPPSPAKQEPSDGENSTPGLLDDTDSDFEKLHKMELEDSEPARETARAKKRATPIGVILVTDRTKMDFKITEKSTKWNETSLAASNGKKPGLSMLDSGCSLCIAGLPTHKEWVKFLAMC